ncbi:MAG: ABC transporter ATP-binding protein [Planctomycetaceae bacterium]
MCLAWSCLAAITLAMLLINLYLIADLLLTRGAIVVPAEEAADFSTLLPDEAPGLALAAPEAIGNILIEDAGILPTVWRSRNTYFGNLFMGLYRATPMLDHNSGALLLLILSAFVIGFIRSLLLDASRRVSTLAALDVVTRIRRTLHRQTLRLGPGDLSETGEEHVLSLFTTEMDRLREGIQNWIYSLARYPVQLALLVLLAFLIDWRLAIVSLTALGLLWWLVRREKRRFEAGRRLEEDRSESELRLLAESLRKTRIVRGYGMEDFEHEQFQKHLDRFRDSVATVKARERWYLWACWILGMLSVGVIVFWVGLKVLLPSETSQGLSLSSALLFMVTLLCMPGALEALWDLPERRRAAAGSADRIFRYLNQVPAVGQAVGAKFLDPLAKTLLLESITFGGPNHRKLIDNLSLKLKAGEVTAVVSFDPLEARTLAYLLPRFIEPQSGRVLFDGEDIAWVTLESLRAEAVFVGGSDPLFTGSVLENVRCGNTDYSLQDVTEATKRTHAHSFILRLPQGYETILGEHGEQLDVGQAFRLGLARAILRNPALLIVEEPTTALDDDAKSLLDDAYNRILRGRTVIFIPSRLSTLRRADRIIFLHRGKVEADGKHSDLVKNSPLYRHWEYTHFNEFRRETE